MAWVAEFTLYQSAVDELTAPSGLIGQEIARRANLVLDRAKSEAPIARGRTPAANPPGYLRSRLVLQSGKDRRGYYIDLVTTSHSREGFAYGTLEEFRQPHIRKAVTDLYGEVSAVTG